LGRRFRRKPYGRGRDRVNHLVSKKNNSVIWEASGREGEEGLGRGKKAGKKTRNRGKKINSPQR